MSKGRLSDGATVHFSFFLLRTDWVDDSSVEAMETTLVGRNSIYHILCSHDDCYSHHAYS